MDGLGTEKLSGRQLAVAVMTGGLSVAAAAAGRADWRWMLAAAPLGVLVFWGILRFTGTRPLFEGARGTVLRVLYGGWAVVLMAAALERAARRISPGNGTAAMFLLVLPLLWMGRGKTAAFFRAAEIFWLAAGVTAGTVLVLGAFRVEGRLLFRPAADWRESLLAGAGVMATGVFALPHLCRVERGEGDLRRGLGWLGGLGLAAAALAAVTAGLLGPETAAQLEEPFFVAAGLLGGSARLEGLISALWLLPDLTYLGLLSRTWGERRWPAAAVLAALALALTGAAGRMPSWLSPAGSLALVILTGALAPGGKK